MPKFVKIIPENSNSLDTDSSYHQKLTPLPDQISYRKYPVAFL